MTRTTVDIDATVLRELKSRQSDSGKTLGALVSELLASAMAAPVREGPAPFGWTSRRMGALVDLDDKEAVRRATGDR
jgi:hypothetical protein